MVNEWEKELELIKSLGKLYPEFKTIISYYVKYKDFLENNFNKAWWITLLCKCHLKRRLPRLEEFIKENASGAWNLYRKDFKIKE